MTEQYHRRGIETPEQRLEWEAFHKDEISRLAKGVTSLQELQLDGRSFQGLMLLGARTIPGAFEVCFIFETNKALPRRAHLGQGSIKKIEQAINSYTRDHNVVRSSFT
jgi:hypothetical protein